VRKLGKVFPNPKGHQTPASEQAAGDSIGLMFSNLPGSTHHLRSDLSIGEMVGRLALGKDVPKNNQQAAGIGNNRFSRKKELGKSVEFAFPIRVEIHGGPSGLPGLTLWGRWSGRFGGRVGRIW
jgi:hypothetical protein